MTFRKVFLITVLLSNIAYAGGAIDSGGGDSYVMDFMASAQKVSAWLKAQNIHEISGLSAERFADTLRKATIISTEEVLILHGIEKDALNYPSENKIIFNRTRWQSMQNEFRKVGLIIHEMLGLMRIDDSGYKTSIQLTTSILGVNPDKNPIFPINYTCKSVATVVKNSQLSYNMSDSVVLGRVMNINNPSFVGLKGLYQQIDGRTYYFGAQLDVGGTPLKGTVFYFSASAPVDTSLSFNTIDTAEFSSILSELPPEFILPITRTIKPDAQTSISFSLRCKLN